MLYAKDVENWARDDCVRLQAFIGKWESCKNPAIEVSSCPLGVLVHMNPSDAQLYKLQTKGDDVVLSFGLTSWRAISATSGRIEWEQTVGDLAWKNGELTTSDELRRLAWTRTCEENWARDDCVRLQTFIGKWESCKNPAIEVSSCHWGC
mmetsp:Transcript_50912/g.142480  ORF Transcript_50912/g.142480 Transcript_50912/m.142480 type:complete len:150 (-) Transcript_50912:69-518(-)